MYNHQGMHISWYWINNGCYYQDSYWSLWDQMRSLCTEQSMSPSSWGSSITVTSYSAPPTTVLFRNMWGSKRMTTMTSQNIRKTMTSKRASNGITTSTAIIHPGCPEASPLIKKPRFRNPIAHDPTQYIYLTKPIPCQFKKLNNSPKLVSCWEMISLPVINSGSDE